MSDIDHQSKMIMNRGREAMHLNGRAHGLPLPPQTFTFRGILTPEHPFVEDSPVSAYNDKRLGAGVVHYIPPSGGVHMHQYTYTLCDGLPRPRYEVL